MKLGNKDPHCFERRISKTNYLTISYSDAIQKVNKQHFLSQMQEPEVRGGYDGHTLLSLWSSNFLNTQKSQGCSQFDIVPPGCRRTLPAHLRWIQKEGCNPHTSSSPSYQPALERSQQSSPATARQGQSAAQTHCTLAGSKPRAVWDLPLYLLHSYKT